jgi:hypothetical protein
MKLNYQIKFTFLLFFLINVLSAQELQPKFVRQFDSFLFTHLDSLYYNENITDTINGNVWTGIYRFSYGIGSSQPTSGEPYPVGYYRTEDRRVYYSDDFSIEGIMYDFNLEVGDVTKVLPWSNSRMDSMVYRVDSIKYMNCFFDDSVKVMYMRPFLNYEEDRPWWFTNIWIEGVGDVQHPFPPISCFSGSSCEGINNWGKYYFEGAWYELWNDSGTAELPCEEIVSSTRSPVLKEPVALSPNPVRPGETLRIRVDGFLAERASLINIAGGQQMAEWTVNLSDSHTVSVPPTVPPGAYLIVLTDRLGRVVRGKVVVN